MSFVFQPKDTSDDFTKDDCCNFCCGIDFIDILLAAYEKFQHEQWEHCLDMKWSVGDCIVGCHNCEDCYDGVKPLLRNSHQFCISRQTIHHVKEELEKVLDRDLDSKVANVAEDDAFEVLYKAISDIVDAKKMETENVSDEIADSTEIYDLQPENANREDVKISFGALTLYDTALRLGWHHVPNRIEPYKYVYLHAGALWGAQNLLRLQKAWEAFYKAKSEKKIYHVPAYKRYFTEPVEFKGNGPVVMSLFCERLRDLGANHLENFLCVFHNELEAYADFIWKKSGVEEPKPKKRKSKKQAKQ